MEHTINKKVEIDFEKIKETAPKIGKDILLNLIDLSMDYVIDKYIKKERIKDA